MKMIDDLYNPMAQVIDALQTFAPSRRGEVRKVAIMPSVFKPGPMGGGNFMPEDARFSVKEFAVEATVVDHFLVWRCPDGSYIWPDDPKLDEEEWF